MVSDPCLLCFILLYGRRRRTDWWWGLSIQESELCALWGKGRRDLARISKGNGNCYKTHYGAQRLGSHF